MFEIQRILHAPALELHNSVVRWKRNPWAIDSVPLSWILADVTYANLEMGTVGFGLGEVCLHRIFRVAGFLSPMGSTWNRKICEGERTYEHCREDDRNATLE